MKYHHCVSIFEYFRFSWITWASAACNANIFLSVPLPTNRCVEGIMFSGCLSVSASVCASHAGMHPITPKRVEVFWPNLIQIFEQSDELIRFWRWRNHSQGHYEVRCAKIWDPISSERLDGLWQRNIHTFCTKVRWTDLVFKIVGQSQGHNKVIFLSELLRLAWGIHIDAWVLKCYLVFCCYLFDSLVLYLSGVLCQNVAGTTASKPHHKWDTRDPSLVKRLTVIQ